MRKKRKSKAQAPEGAATTPAPVPAVSTSLKGAIADWKAQLPAVSKATTKPASKPATKAATQPASRPVVTLPPPGPAPPSLVPPPLTAEDRDALARAFAGVQPMTKRTRGGPSATLLQAQRDARQHEVHARQRLDALVGAGAPIVVTRDDHHVTGLRAGVPNATLRRLQGAKLRPEATLDLHGERAADVTTLVTKFVRMQHRKGLRLLLIIHGKGLHSEGGVGVLVEPAIAALHEGGAAPLVAAFTTAHSDHGGSGALMVELVSG